MESVDLWQISDRRKGGDRRSKGDSSHSAGPGAGSETGVLAERRNLCERRSSIPRRKHERIRVQDDVFAVTKNRINLAGQVIDFSSSGLSFRYIDEGVRAHKSFKIDMVYTGRSFAVRDIPFVTLSDQRIESGYSFSSMPIRRCGGRFGKLSKKQAEKIEYLFNNYISFHFPGQG